jgi:exodeoxyribonuclease VII small subunit
MAEKYNEDIAKLSYEQARDELGKVLGDLEAGSVTLEQSMQLWERGEALAKHCQALLAGAKAKIDEALKDK